MAKHPDVQRKVQAELDEKVGVGSIPKLSDRVKLPYTEATLCEVQRLATLVPLAMPHRAMDDTKLCGYDIPKGAIILPNIWAVHRDPKIWPLPYAFDPGNFYKLSGDRVELRNTEYLIPFSIGI